MRFAMSCEFLLLLIFILLVKKATEAIIGLQKDTHENYKLGTGFNHDENDFFCACYYCDPPENAFRDVIPQRRKKDV